MMKICWGEFKSHGQTFSMPERHLIFHSQIDNQAGWFTLALHAK